MGRAEDIFDRLVREGEPAIDEFIATRQSEELFLDFKRSTDNGSGRVLQQVDRNNLAKAIYGFGNSEGGVIVWGIDCSSDDDHGDVARCKVPIQNPRRFLSWIEGAVSGCTVPPLVGVKNHSIIQSAQDVGFVATYIPKSDQAPHQVVGALQYYMRAGSSFAPVPHGVLAGMFGRRPQPHVFSIFTLTLPRIVMERKIEIFLDLLIRNNGPVIASDLFMNTMVTSFPGNNSALMYSWDPSREDHWFRQSVWARDLSVISQPSLRLPPESQVQAYKLQLYLKPPFTDDLKIEGLCGCGQSPPFRFTLQKARASIEEFYEGFVELFDRNGLLPEEDQRRFADLWQKDWVSSAETEEK